MPKRKQIDKKTLVSVAADAIAGLSKRTLMTKYPAVSERVIRVLMQNDVGAEEWRAALMKEIQATAGEALLELRRAIRDGRLSANSLPIALGILIDKTTTLDARNMMGAVAVNVQINAFSAGSSREQMLAALRPAPSAVLPNNGDSSGLIPSTATPSQMKPWT